MSASSLPSWTDDDLVLISALEHWSYCPRQCGLIHVEQIFDENRYTQRGKRAHERIDSGAAGTERGVRQLRSITLWSDRLGLIGKSDLVEFRGKTPVPVETKSGTSARRDWRHESLQLCAQAICLEEMLGINVPSGAIFSATDRKRTSIEFDPELRHEVERATIAIRDMVRVQRLPEAVNDARCKKCSLLESCAPAISARPERVLLMHDDLFDVLPAEMELARDRG
ncbi:MAG: CRISPR-associated protein Cas4 [Thermomicrobiales bacterium]